MDTQGKPTPRHPGRPRKNQADSVESASEQPSVTSETMNIAQQRFAKAPMEAAEAVVRQQEKAQSDFTSWAKRNTAVYGYKIKLYFNDSKGRKRNACKLVLLTRNPAKSFEQIIARYCPISEGQKLMIMTPMEAHAEHEKRKSLPNYGFHVMARPKAA